MIIQLFEDATKVVVEDSSCECGAQLMSVEYKQDKTKLPKGLSEMTGCVFCEPAFTSLVSTTLLHYVAGSSDLVTKHMWHFPYYGLFLSPGGDAEGGGCTHRWRSWCGSRARWVERTPQAQTQAQTAQGQDGTTCRLLCVIMATYLM